jgi:glycosyltransferase involved in cell wall biosynthesis
MRVIHVTKTVGVGGSERHLLDLLPAQRARGVDAQLILLQERGRPSPQLTEEFRSRGVPTREIRVRADADPLLVGALVRTIRRVRPEIVHTHLVHADTHAAIAARIARVPGVVGSRHSLLAELDRERVPVQQAVALTARLTHHVIVISDAVGEATHRIERVPRERMSRIYYGVPLPDVTPEPEPGLVATVGRVVPRKGLETLIDAWRLVEPRSAERLVIVGDGPLRRELERRANAAGIDGSIHFAGHSDDVLGWLRRVAVFVQPSLSEGLGLSALEAAACGLPIVASRVGGLMEVVAEGETGLLVPPGEPEPLARALRSALDDPALRGAMGAAGRRRVQEVFSPERMVEETIAVYRGVLA